MSIEEKNSIEGHALKLGRALWQHHIFRNIVAGAVLGVCVAYFIPFMKLHTGAVLGALFMGAAGIYKNLNNNRSPINQTNERFQEVRDIPDELIKFNDLRKNGIITDAEFENRKKKILKE